MTLADVEQSRATSTAPGPLAHREIGQEIGSASDQEIMEIPSKRDGEHVLCRGWTANDVRQAVVEASDAQKAVLAEIAAKPGITIVEIAANLGLPDWRNARGVLAAWSRCVTFPMGITDPATGKPSWPWTHGRDTDGLSTYDMPPSVSEIVLDLLGRSR